jgi:hypothetical protein
MPAETTPTMMMVQTNGHPVRKQVQDERHQTALLTQGGLSRRMTTAGLDSLLPVFLALCSAGAKRRYASSIIVWVNATANAHSVTHMNQCANL